MNKSKAKNPLESIDPEKVSPIAAVYFEFAYLKQLYRQGWLAHGIPPDRCESVAEHTLGVAFLAMLLAFDHNEKLDLVKVLQMAILHDFGEIYAGDIVPGEGVTTEEKYQLEFIL